MLRGCTGNSKHAAYMANVCVSGAARRQGVGAALVNKARQLCKTWGEVLERGLSRSHVENSQGMALDLMSDLSRNSNVHFLKCLVMALRSPPPLHKLLCEEEICCTTCTIENIFVAWRKSIAGHYVAHQFLMSCTPTVRSLILVFLHYTSHTIT